MKMTKLNEVAIAPQERIYRATRKKVLSPTTDPIKRTLHKTDRKTGQQAGENTRAKNDPRNTSRGRAMIRRMTKTNMLQKEAADFIKTYKGQYNINILAEALKYTNVVTIAMLLDESNKEWRTIINKLIDANIESCVLECDAEGLDIVTEDKANQIAQKLSLALPSSVVTVNSLNSKYEILIEK